ncbi:hypothetical protein C8N32_101241 [Rhodovulum imhoffii]|uniref:Uncharacterized protein n=1 Tax=Rhodovulum imhoffii TaxID=365340 RepID=A0A2T5BWP4_9RHOB|nr:hypothetical protein [Rhodovulum imhoffii]MBK5933284.1 hypothetical protein [Rhodovulum imhoffii]PTN04043.1 hypothetical protein C8N32_101241 [Rhodovulum imhoffii]
MKICVFGNSHTACLIEAWRAVRLGGEMDFFVQAGTGPAGMQLADGRIEPESARHRAFLERLGLPVRLDLTHYDALAVVGCGISKFRLTDVLNCCHVLGWPCPNPSDLPVITEPCLRAALSDALAGTTGASLVRRLRAARADVPVFAIPQPAPSERLLKMRCTGGGFRRLIRQGLALHAAEVFRQVARAVCSAEGAVFLPQPDATMTHGILTTGSFSTAATRLVDLKTPHPDQDILHANGAYGAVVLEALQAALRQGGKPCIPR